MSETREWKYPVGTVRERSDGKYIKTHDNGLMDSIINPWMKVTDIPEIFLQLFNECDRLGRSIFNHKDPIEGELWLDKEMNEFKTSRGVEFSADDFKKYSPYSSRTYGYDFHSELSQRYLADLIARNEFIKNSLEELNDKKREDLHNKGQVADTIELTEDEIKGIKSKAKSIYAEKLKTLTFEDTEELVKQLTKVNDYLDKGFDLQEEQKDLYEESQKLISDLKGNQYIDIDLIKERLKNIFLKLDIVYGDNWGIINTLTKKLNKSFDYYIKKFESQLSERELSILESKGINIYSDTDTFYNDLQNKFLDEEAFEPKYIVGELISSFNPYETKYKDYEVVSVKEREGEVGLYDIKYKDTITGIESERFRIPYEELERVFILKNFPDLSIPLKLRFNKLYNKEIEGDWSIQDLITLQVIERVSNYLPNGHLLNNDFIKIFKKEDVLKYEGNKYAYFSERRKEIYLSNKASRYSQRSADINNGSEVASVLIHEIGHGVATKLGKGHNENARGLMKFKKFVKACGWSWEQFQGSADRGWLVTNTMDQMKRFGSFKDTPLISEYAGSSPNEAFAEYYSFYSQYKKEIDALLKGDDSQLQKVEKPKITETKTQFSDFDKGINISVNDIDNILLKNKRDFKTHIKSDLLDSFNKSIHNIKSDEINPYKVISHKSPKSFTSDNYQSPNPIFTVFDTISGKHEVIKKEEPISGTKVTGLIEKKGNHHYIDLKGEKLSVGELIYYELDGEKYKGRIVKENNGGKNYIRNSKIESFVQHKLDDNAYIHTANKYLRRDTPTYSISKEVYNILSEAGYSSEQIQAYTLKKLGDKKIPKAKVDNNNNSEFHKGLLYCGEVVTSNVIKRNSHVFREMKEIWESEELKKALNDMFDDKSDNVEKASSIMSLSSFFKPFVDVIRNALQNDKKTEEKEKTIYSDVLVRNIYGDILFLERGTVNDDYPGKYCLPGGHVEKGETPEEGAARELFEETSLEVDEITPLRFVKSWSDDKSIIYYYEYLITGKTPEKLYLDNEEHFRYEFVKVEDLDKHDYIFDLKDKIKTYLWPNLTHNFNNYYNSETQNNPYPQKDLFNRLEQEKDNIEIQPVEIEQDRGNKGCLMLDIESLDIREAQTLIRQDDLVLVDKIDNRLLGIEDELHITILYGIHDDEVIPKQLLESIDLNNISFDIKEFSLFEAESYDVLKLTIESESLISLNQFLRTMYNYTNKYPDYKAHLTLGYLRKGLGKIYCDALNKLYPKTGDCKIIGLTYSDRDRKKYRLYKNPSQEIIENQFNKGEIDEEIYYNYLINNTIDKMIVEN